MIYADGKVTLEFYFHDLAVDEHSISNVIDNIFSEGYNAELVGFKEEEVYYTEKIINLNDIKENLERVKVIIKNINEELEDLGERAENIGTDYTAENDDSCRYISNMIDCIDYRLKEVKEEISKGITD